MQYVFLMKCSHIFFSKYFIKFAISHSLMLFMQLFFCSLLYSVNL